MRHNDVLTIGDHGAQCHRGAAVGDLDRLRAILSHLPEDHAGIRITSIRDLYPLLAPQGRIGSVAADILGQGSRAVRAVLFDKTATTNWALGWHQDRTIVVRQRINMDGFGPWTTKRDMQHVAPPFGLLQRMVTLRVHLDDVPASNAPLLIAPGSHRDGRIPVDMVPTIVGLRGIRSCLAEAGDIWLYATPILHASDAAAMPKRRRVLQIDFAAEELPGGLQWLGV